MAEEGGNESLSIEQGIQKIPQIDGVTSAHTVDHGNQSKFTTLLLLFQRSELQLACLSTSNYVNLL